MQQSFSVKVAPNGRMVLPAPVRAALGLSGETQVTLTLNDGEVAVHAMSKHVRRAQELYRKYATSPVSVDEFLEARRQEDDRKDRQLGG